MEDKNLPLESLLERAEDFGKTSLELWKLKALDKMSEMFSSLTLLMIIFASIFLFFGFLNIGIALWLGQILGNIYYGFFLVAVFYGFIGFILYSFMRKWIKTTAGNFFIKQVLNNDKWEK